MPVIRRPLAVAPRDSSTVMSDRRAELRYRLAMEQGQVGWWEGAEFVTVEARLLDIGTGGAAVRVRSLPPMDRRIYLRLEDRTITTESVSAMIVHVAALRPRGFELRLAFDVPCPPALFQAATCGFKALRSLLN